MEVDEIKSYLYVENKYWECKDMKVQDFDYGNIVKIWGR